LSSEPVAADAVYRLAISDYLAAGGDGYAALGRGKVVSDTRFAKLLATVAPQPRTGISGR
jgi:2',3'-cyclic-nucleotide 2'-phosphodiesterase (5'-nucleotidase family)